jgi:hypothetical protein
MVLFALIKLYSKRYAEISNVTYSAMSADGFAVKRKITVKQCHMEKKASF